MEKGRSHITWASSRFCETFGVGTGSGGSPRIFYTEDGVQELDKVGNYCLRLYSPGLIEKPLGFKKPLLLKSTWSWTWGRGNAVTACAKIQFADTDLE